MDWISLVLPEISPARIAQWGIILSFLMPYLIACIQQRRWSDAVRARVSFGLCALVASGVLVCEGLLTTTNLLASATALFALSATLHRHFAKQNGADALEGVTSAIWNGFIGVTATGSNRGPLVVTLPTTPLSKSSVVNSAEAPLANPMEGEAYN